MFQNNFFDLTKFPFPKKKKKAGEADLFVELWHRKPMHQGSTRVLEVLEENVQCQNGTFLVSAGRVEGHSRIAEKSRFVHLPLGFGIDGIQSQIVSKSNWDWLSFQQN